jgi:PhoH-like ATPase
MDIKEVVVSDTNIIIDDPRAILKFTDTLVVIPRVVIEELDKLKAGKDANARRMSRIASGIIDRISEEHEDKLDMPLENGSFLRIESGLTKEFESSDPDKPDNMIISVALGYAKQGYSVTLYSNDVNVRVFARQLAKDNFPNRLNDLPLKARKYDIIDSSLYDINSGVSDLILPDIDVNMLRKNGFHSMQLPYINGEHIMVRSETNPEKNIALAVWDKRQGRIISLPDYKKGEPVWRIGVKNEGATDVRPKDARQSFLMHDLMDTSKNLHFVLSRVAGAGKNFVATACALRLLKDGQYDRLIIIKPMISDHDIGFLPGDKEQKMAPWFESFNDTITELTNDRGLTDDLNARIELDIITHMRGRTIPRVIMILDESQNFTENDIKTLGTRVGVDAKIVLMGDLSQIDNPRLDAGNSGLRVWAERARDSKSSMGYSNSTYILLDSNFRSEISAWFSSFYE